jgi:type I restriction enzyme S subunit
MNEVTEKVHRQVPMLRFPAFKGNWSKRALGDGCEILMCKRIFANQTAESGDVPFYKIGTLCGKPDSYITRKHFEDFKERYNYPRAGETLITCAGTVGKCLQFDGHDSYYQDSNIVWIDNPEEHVINDFLFLLLSKIDWSKLNSTTITRIYSNDLRALELNIPEALPEQQKIAAFLGAVDRKIQQLKRKQALLEQYKKGVVQQLFAQELRFKRKDGGEFPDWEEKRLGEIAYITTGTSNRVDSSLDAQYTFFDRSVDVRRSSIFLYDTEAIIVGGEGQEFVPKHFTGKFDLHQRAYAIMNFKGATGPFLFQYIDKHRAYFLTQAVGSTVKSLRLPMFTGMPISLPCLEEQSRIAGFLMALDAKVAGVAQAVAAAQRWKRGLLQQMFV